MGVPYAGLGHESLDSGWMARKRSDLINKYYIIFAGSAKPPGPGIMLLD
jgi:hypothetical protein